MVTIRSTRCSAPSAASSTAQVAAETAPAPVISRAAASTARSSGAKVAPRPSVSAATWAVLEAGLGAEHLVDLIVTIGFYCGVVRILASLEIAVEPEYMTYLEQFPLPGAPA